MAIPAEKTASVIGEKLDYITSADRVSHSAGEYVCSRAENGFTFHTQDDILSLTKTIQATGEEILWSYDFYCKQDIAAINLTIPVIIDDGYTRLDVKKLSPYQFSLVFNGNIWMLTCAEEMCLALKDVRSTQSVSGIASIIQVTVGALVKNKSFNGYVRLRMHSRADISSVKALRCILDQPITAKPSIARTAPDAVNRSVCTGCGSCAQACPYSRIDMREDEFGFLYPVLSQDGCTGCDKCVRVCPLGPNAAHQQIDSYPQPFVYGAWNLDDDILYASASGGVFHALARQILRDGGQVCAAHYSPEHSVVFSLFARQEELIACHGSKYVESSIGDCYQKIRVLLEKEIPVLFVSLPCQAAGLRSFLGKHYEKLYLVDLVCGGVPSRLAFRKYLDEIEKQTGVSVRHYAFRDKRFGWTANQSLIVTLADSSQRVLSKANDPYYRAYQSGESVRESCFHCEFFGYRSQADITIGDFNGAASINWKDPNAIRHGISVVVVHNEHGRQLFTSCQNSLILQRVSFQTAAAGNKRLRELRRIPPQRTQWLVEMAREGSQTFANMNLNALCLTQLSGPPKYARLGTPLTWRAFTAGGQGHIQYAWYLFKDGTRIHTKWYTCDNTFTYEPDTQGVYSVRAFAQSETEKTAVLSENTTVIE